MDRRRVLAFGVVGAVVVAAAVAVAVAFAAGVGGVGTSSGDRGTGGLAAPARAPELALPDAAGRNAAGQDTAGSQAPPDQLGRAVVRQAAVRVDVADPAAAVRDVRSVVVAAGGFVADERSGSSAGSGADLTVRVPAAGLDALLDRVGALGTVTERTATARDVTDQLVDTDARVASRRASVERVRALLARAETIGEIVSVESELTARQADLDSLERRLAGLRGSVELATVSVSLQPLGAPPAAEPGTGFGAGLGEGWARLKAIGAGLAAAGGYLLPFLPVVALLVLAGRPLWKRARARRKPAPADAA